MRARDHVIASTGVSLVFGAAVHSWPATLVCFLSGILIDLDHYLEYYFHRGKFPWRYKDLVDFCMPYKENKVYLIFHAYEHLVILWALIYCFQMNSLWVGMALGLSVHLMFDQFTNPIKPMAYFLIFRAQNKFDTVKIINEHRVVIG